MIMITDESTVWSIADFEFGRIIGKGLFGTVYHGRFKRKRSGGQEVAIKVMDRCQIMKRRQYIDMVMNERRILSKLGSSPYIIKLFVSFLDEANLYLVLDLCICDLAMVVESASEQHLQEKNSSILDIASVRCIASQLLLALEFIHSQNIVHRDIKPQNILLTRWGRIKLIDFATAIEVKHSSMDIHATTVSPETLDFVGTADYLAPEVLLEKNRHGVNIHQDFWSMGCVIYFMFVGQSPFHTESDYLTFKKIYDYASNSDVFQLPSTIPLDAADFIHQLLSRDPSQRFFGDSHDTTDIHRRKYEMTAGHPFLAGIEWESIRGGGDLQLPSLLMETLSQCFIKQNTQQTMVDGSSVLFDFFA